MPVDPLNSERETPYIADHVARVDVPAIGEDPTDFPWICSAIYIGAEGGTLAILTKGGEVAAIEVAPFTYHPIRASAVFAETTPAHITILA